MERVLIKETINYIGKKIRICGWVNIRRDHGKIVFLDLRDMSGIIQTVVSDPELAKGVQEESAVEVEGEVKERPEKMINPDIETGKIELSAEKIKILSLAESLPFDIKDLKVTLPTLLDNRPLTLRNSQVKAIFKIEEEVLNSFRKTLKDLGFTEFHAPTIVPANAEGGAEVFHIDYYDGDAYLAQSPQLYKQIMVGVFERVFTIAHVYRAEPSVTTRHLSEYTSLDAEMGFIDSWTDLMDTCEILIRNIFSDIQKDCQKEIKALKVTLPEAGQKIPRIKMREAQQIIFERTKRDNRKEPDLDPEDEKEICKFSKEKYSSDLIFITHYPTKKRPFYTYQDPEDENYTLSFDLLCRGLEIVTGGQRIHQYKKLLENIKKWGNKPEDFSFYLQAFKYGMPPEGGFAFGLERVVKQILGLENLREASAFPRDMERIDQRLSLLKTKKDKKSRKK
ncbi:MAG: aspartate--tRNA(Asn) ligase [Candidatus Paceibacterota bacterium]